MKINIKNKNNMLPIFSNFLNELLNEIPNNR